MLKPSPYTPLEILILGEIADEAGLPPGVLNIITGDIEAGTEITTNAKVDAVRFTGSDTVGRTIYTQAGVRGEEHEQICNLTNVSRGPFQKVQPLTVAP